MDKYRRLAAGVLLFSAAGSAATLPLQGSFAGALLHHGFLAATVGGLADWFAVTALFRKPLGIGWRTEIIPRNYNRIINELTDFFCHDLLSAENIALALEKYRLAPLIFSYLKEPKGKALLCGALAQIFQTALQRADLSAAEESLKKAASAPVRQLHPSVILADAAAETLRRGSDAPLTELLIEETSEICSSQQMLEIIKTLLSRALKNYRHDNILNRILIHISPEKLAREIQNYILQSFSLLRMREHPWRQNLHEKLLNYVKDLRSSQKLTAWADDKFQTAANEKLPAIISWLRSASEEDLKELCSVLAEKIADDEELQKSAEPLLHNLLAKFLRENSSLPKELLQQNLKDLSPDELVQYIEERVGDDLQMIRINGAAVGGAAGMLLYTITWLAERMWS